MVKNKSHPSKVSADSLLVSLEEVARKIGVKIRYEKIAGGPVKASYGSCKIRGEDVILIDRRMGDLEKVHALARELTRFNLEEVFINPAARKFLKLNKD